MFDISFNLGIKDQNYIVDTLKWHCPAGHQYVLNVLYESSLRNYWKKMYCHLHPWWNKGFDNYSYPHKISDIITDHLNSPHKGQWHGALMFSLISAWKNAWVNNRVAGELLRRDAHHDVTVMECVYVNVTIYPVIHFECHIYTIAVLATQPI